VTKDAATAGLVRRSLIKRGVYRDSVILMRISMRLREIEGVSQAELLIGTPNNIEALKRSGLLTQEAIEADPGPSDLVIALEGEGPAVATALREAEEMIARGTSVSDAPAEAPDGRSAAKTLSAAIPALPGANLALISIPGPFVRREAMKALHQGLNLLIFSNNVSLEDEVAMKEEAARLGLLCMGPDCGTAMLSGAALAFANVVRPGPVGIVGAAGTGIQEIAALVHQAGSGVSHAIGTGTNDVGQVVGGLAMMAGLDLLEADPATKVMVLVGKPPHPETTVRVVARLAKLSKPSVVCFLGADPTEIRSSGAVFARTLEEAAAEALALVQHRPNGNHSPFTVDYADVSRTAKKESAGLAASQRFVRGLYGGGTLANEAALILHDLVGEVSANLGLDCVLRLKNPRRSSGHTIVDLGDEVFTQGRPHPMLEPAMREERLLAEAADETTATVLMDVVLGYGAHVDPAGVLVKSLRRARSLAERAGRHLPIVASVCGTDADPQDRGRQVEILREAGVIVMPTNAQATRMAAMIACRG